MSSMSCKKTKCLIIHGFGGGVHEVKPLAEYLIGLGYDVLGVFLPMLWTKFRYFKKTILVGVTVSLTIELIQLLFSFLGLSGRLQILMI